MRTLKFIHYALFKYKGKEFVWSFLFSILSLIVSLIAFFKVHQWQ